MVGSGRAGAGEETTRLLDIAWSFSLDRHLSPQQSVPTAKDFAPITVGDLGVLLVEDISVRADHRTVRGDSVLLECLASHTARAWVTVRR
jgi:hypothetical protein